VNGVSAVVDENGEPKVVYHGTSNTFDSFDKTRVGSHFGLPATGRLGFYFTNDNALANDYAARGNVIPVFLRMNNPLVIEDTGWGSAVNQTDTRESDLRRWAQEGGHDGIIIRSTDEELLSGELDTVYVAFEPNQIKSVENRGTFDESANIYNQSAAPADTLVATHGIDVSALEKPFPTLATTPHALRNRDSAHICFPWFESHADTKRYQ
ncbi:MAG: hypothetical protein J6Z30_07595, partial [Pyramidobacter sp.]|nr:hypothetical protein [Pyramidobacter sp.]